MSLNVSTLSTLNIAAKMSLLPRLMAMSPGVWCHLVVFTSRLLLRRSQVVPTARWMFAQLRANS